MATRFFLLLFVVYLLIDQQYCALPPICAKCVDLNQQQQAVFTTTPVNTYDISAYTCDQIKYLTAYGSQGDLSCSDTSNTLTFTMSSSGAMRVLFGGGNAVVSGTCCDAANPRRVCNAPDKQSDLNELCRNLGYLSATFTLGSENSCPEAYFSNEIWTSDFQSSSGSITQFTCTGCTVPDPPQQCATTSNPSKNPTHTPTPAPTAFPTPSPTTNPTINPTKIPTKNPSTNPTKNPTSNPTKNPTNNPTNDPTKNPSHIPTKTPSISPTTLTLNPTKNPTISPTKAPVLPEGAVGDSPIESENDDQNNDTDEQLKQNNSSNGINGMFNGNMLIYIIVICAGLFIICCIIIATCFYKKKLKKRSLNKTNMEHTAADNTTTKMVQLGSVSPRSINAVVFDETNAFETVSGVSVMSGVTEGAIIATNTNELDNQFVREYDASDGDNELFVETGANVNGVTAGQEHNKFPELPANDNDDDDEDDDSETNETDNELYRPEVTTGGADIVANKICNECGETVMLNSGREDENDGNWYCNNCWNSFCE